MKKRFWVPKPAVLLGLLITSSLVLIAYKRKQKTKKIKKWINWKIEFKKDATIEEKTKALIAIKRYILDYLSSSGAKFASIKFINTLWESKGPLINLNVDLIDPVAKDAVATKKPPPKPPKR